MKTLQRDPITNLKMALIGERAKAHAAMEEMTSGEPAHWPAIPIWDVPDFAPTAETWGALSIQAKVSAMISIGGGDTITVYEDMLDVMPAETKEWLAAWQAMINRGSVWGATSGSIGRQADQLIQEGYCLLGHEPTIDWLKQRIPSRHEVKDGTEGSPGHVIKTMSKRYLDWIAAVP